MRNWIAVTAVIAVGFVHQAAAQTPPEQSLAIIEDGGKESTRKRFKFILGSLVKRCSDIKTEKGVADKLAVVSRMVKDAGVDESILKTAENLHKMTRDITTGSGKPSVGCVPAWAMYSQLRQEGYPADEAIGAVTVLAGLTNLAR